MIYIVDGIVRYTRPAECSIQGSKGQHHHCRGYAVLCTRDAVAVSCANYHSNIMDEWDRCCINHRVMAGITLRCLGRLLRDGVHHRDIDHLPKKRNQLKREGGGIDAASKDAPPFTKWMELVQGMAHQRKYEDTAAKRDAQNKPKMRVCLSHMVQRLHNAAEGCTKQVVSQKSCSEV